MKNYLKLAIISLVLLWIPGLSGILSAEEIDEDDARDRLESLSEEEAALRNQINNMQHAERLASDELEDIDTELSRIQANLSRTQQTLQRKRTQVDLLNQSHETAMNDLENAQTKFESRLVEWYKNGASSVLGSLVTSGDLGDFLDVMYYTDAIIESDKETIVFIQDQQGQIYSQRETLYSEISEYDNLLEQMRKDEERLAELRQSRYSRLSEIADDVDQAEEALSELEASSYEIAMMLQVSRYTGTSGPLIKPVDAPFGSGFGMRNHPILGRNRMHEGQDFPAPAGTPIHAAGNGLVVHSGWKRGYGYTIIIDHGNGLATLYGHCSALLVGVGETINRGQVIARVGTTGLSTGNHLHFEVRINGDPTDPVPYITGN